MIRIQAPSRLHFGLLNFGTKAAYSDRLEGPGLALRQFGSVGLMVRAPGVTVVAHPAATWSAEGPLAERALAFARKLTHTFAQEAGTPLRFCIGDNALEHVGLGTGTQLGLAVARAVSMAWGQVDLSIEELARRIGRGARSALGIHGFAHGGFLVDGGKGDPERVAPLVARANFPEAWRIVLAVLPREKGLHGKDEHDAFARLVEREVRQDFTDSLCRLVLLGMLPALIERDLDTFGEAVFDFNARVGEGFAPVQGGAYASPRVAEVVAFIRKQGIRGVGQSSWGPVVFAITESDAHASDLVWRLRIRFNAELTTTITTGCNCGALVSNS
jgi:beta-RFAP synthase